MQIIKVRHIHIRCAAGNGLGFEAFGVDVAEYVVARPGGGMLAPSRRVVDLLTEWLQYRFGHFVALRQIAMSDRVRILM